MSEMNTYQIKPVGRLSSKTSSLLNIGVEINTRSNTRLILEYCLIDGKVMKL